MNPAGPAGRWPTQHLVVTGMPGVGKSTVTAELAPRLGRTRRDSDDDIAALFGMTGRELAARDGVDELHRVEAAVLLGALADPTPHVIAAAGSIIDDAMCRAALDQRAALFVLVNPAASEAVEGTDHRRPIDTAEMAALIARREPLWQAQAVAVIDVERTPRQIADEIIERFTSIVPLPGCAGSGDG